MDPFTPCAILFQSTTFVQARIAVLTPAQIAADIDGKWWQAAGLKASFDPPPIDLHWGWGPDAAISWNEGELTSEKVGLLTGDGYIQGALLISTAAVPSILEPAQGALFIERLCTAPQNRSRLRADGRKYFGGVGLELLRWGVLRSRDAGHGGRVRLEASPDYVQWYADLGFQKLAVEPETFNGVQYTPVELPVDRVDNLLERKVTRSPIGVVR